MAIGKYLPTLQRSLLPHLQGQGSPLKWKPQVSPKIW